MERETDGQTAWERERVRERTTRRRNNNRFLLEFIIFCAATNYTVHTIYTTHFERGKIKHVLRTVQNTTTIIQCTQYVYIHRSAVLYIRLSRRRRRRQRTHARACVSPVVVVFGSACFSHHAQLLPPPPPLLVLFDARAAVRVRARDRARSYHEHVPTLALFDIIIIIYLQSTAPDGYFSPISTSTSTSSPRADLVKFISSQNVWGRDTVSVLVDSLWLFIIRRLLLSLIFCQGSP